METIHVKTVPLHMLKQLKHMHRRMLHAFKHDQIYKIPIADYLGAIEAVTSIICSARNERNPWDHTRTEKSKRR